MPIRRKKNSTYKRRRKTVYRARKRYAKKVRRTPFMLGRGHKCKLRYESIVHLTPSIDPGAHHIWRANDLFDPNYSGAGHQPRGFDQLMGMFDHFNVIGSKISVKFINNDSLVQGVLCSIVLRDSSTPIPNTTTLREYPGIASTVLGHSVSGRNMGTLSKGFSAKKFFGKSLAADEQQGSSTASPLEQAYFFIGCTSQASGTVNSVECYVTIDYTAIFTEPKMPATS